VSDLTTPPNWALDLPPLSNAPAPAPAPAPAEKARHEGFRWPTPPFAAYPDALEQNQPQACQIVGLNDREMTGRLIFFVPESTVAHVQVPPARTTMALRFTQFRSLRVVEPLKPASDASRDPHAGMLEHRPSSRYKVTLKSGALLEGDTIGHVDTPHGLFLFPPIDAQGSVQRLFVPREAYENFEIGERIGDLLVAQKMVTPQQVAQAADMQQQLRNQKLGDILVSRQIVTPIQLLSAIEQQAKMPMVRIGEALTSLGLVSEEQLQDALSQQKNDRSVPLGELLVRMGTVSREDLQTALARKMGYPVVNVNAFPVEAEALRKLPYAAAARLLVLPLLIREGRLVIAIDDPARRRNAVDEVEFIAQMKIVPVLALGRSVADTIFEAYEKIGAANHHQGASGDSPDRPIEFTAADTGKLMETLEKEQNELPGFEDERQIEQSDNSLVRLINNMIIEAHKEGVSDIHIESYPGRDKIKIRFRKDGTLRTHLELPPNYRNALIARIKIMCDLDISERRKPQDGKINFSKFSAQHKIELRVATIPTNSGLEDVVMRILASAKPIPLDNLGLSPWNLKHLKEAMERPYGLVLCVGPTGSGKTTTLHSALSHINVPERKIWTAEDPVEITQPGLRQVQVNPKIDWTFAKALRAFLRADPDVIMVGEMRDGETAQMGVEASLTGHLVLSTLHTNSAPETVTRLIDMGLDPFNFADSLLGVLAQRLVRRLCPHCRVARLASADEIDELLHDYLHICPQDHPGFQPDVIRTEWTERFGQNGQLMHYHSPGCDKCGGTGQKGRAGLHELMIVSRELRRLIQTSARAEQLLQCALLEGMRTLRQDGIEKVLQGATSLAEVRATSNT
jgi:type II secretory ATPase GspE/PulE/Tfp pilus assembly ATPase PilB-like protein